MSQVKKNNGSDAVVKIMTIFSSITNDFSSEEPESPKLLKIPNDGECEFSPKQIRRVMEMYLKGIRLEVILKRCENRYISAMRGIFHCEKCFKSWNDSKELINCTETETFSVAGDAMIFGKEEALHIIKIASGSCYSDTGNVVQILNEMNQNVDGTFFAAAGNLLKNGYRNDYSPVLLSTPCGRKIPGTFIFSKLKCGNDNGELFSPYFNIPISVRGVKPSKRIFPIFEDERKTPTSKTKKKSIFCTLEGKIFDARKIFSSGFLGCFTNWEAFFAGEMHQDCFIPTACVLDSGIVLFWPRDNRKLRKVTFESLEEILEQTKRSFPCFPEEKATDRKGSWTLITDRKFSNTPKEFCNRSRGTENGPLGVLYLGGSANSLPKTSKYVKIEYQAFTEPGEVISRASSETRESFSAENDKVVPPSGLPMDVDDDTHIVGGVPMNSPDREIESMESYTRRPSVAWFREVNSSEDLIQKKSSSSVQRNPPEVVNPAVKNRTGKPPTRRGQLSDGTSAITIGGQTRQITPKPMKMIQRETVNRSSSSNFQSLTGIARDFEMSRKRSILQGEGRAPTPTMIKKTDRNEFEGLKANERSTLPSTAEKSRTVTMRQRTGEIKSAGTNKKQKDRRKSRGDSMQKLLDGVDKLPKEEIVPEDKPIDLPNEISNDAPTKKEDDEDRDFALPSEHYLRNAEYKKSKKSLFLPFLNDHSLLNFTESFRFSYFMMPAYIKEKNARIKNGLFKLPIIKQDLEPQKRRSKDRSDLMKRIERLNKFNGSTAARVRQ